MKEIISRVLSVFPDSLKKPLEKAFDTAPTVYEIRLIAENSVFFYTSNGVRFVTQNGGIALCPCSEMLVPTFEQLENISNRAIGFSGFSHEQELKRGYITYGGACRMGICTHSDSDFFGYGKITSLAVRIPFSGKSVYDTRIDSVLRQMQTGLLIASPPGGGKTTLLRYVARKLSDGVSGEMRKVTVVDERGELSDGNFLGSCTDVICGKDKAQAILHAVRTLSPHYIICDEIGTEGEAYAILDGLNSGVAFVFSVHAHSLEALVRKKQVRILYENGVFDSLIFLSAHPPGKIENIYSGGEIDGAISRNCGGMSFVGACGHVC